MPIKEELVKILGKDKVSDKPDDLGKYAKDESFMHPVTPRCVVKPDNIEEIQKVVNWANETLTALVPVSSGVPHFRGDTVPSMGGTVIVDLSSMKKIVRVDAEHRIAMFEPGVTFGELIPTVRKEGLRLNMPLLPRASKSVIGSLLEREPVIMPKYHWDISDPMACTEIIFGTGDMFRTGAAAGPGSLEEQWKAGAAQNEALGPIQADFLRLFQGAQGTMGIVTWATVRCEYSPIIEEPYLIGSSKLDSLLEFTYWLIRNRMADDCLLLNNSNLAYIMAKNWPQEYESIKKTLPPWILFFTISGTNYFPEEKVNYLKGDMTALAQSIGVEPLRALGRVSAFELLKTVHEPSEEPYWKLRGKGSCYDLFFITIYDKLPELVSLMNSVAEKFGYPLSDLGVYIQPIVQGVNYHCEFNLFFDPGNRKEKEIIRGLAEAAINALSNRGAFFSRPYDFWAEMTYLRDVETTIALKKIKKIFDPNNIMNPGKLCF